MQNYAKLRQNYAKKITQKLRIHICVNCIICIIMHPQKDNLGSIRELVRKL